MSAADTELLFLPLGGAGEIGMNLNLFGYGPPDRHRWLMIDCGVTFGGDGVPGLDVLMPDPSYIAERRDQLDGLLLTHAHEDHLGAVPYLWPQLRCPVYGTPFALAVLRRKLEEVGLADDVPMIDIVGSGITRIGAFELDFVGMTHSIPEANAVALRTDLGVVLHTGDWKLDPAPVVGGVSDEAGLRRLGDRGVTALICDSTNVFEAGRTGSEADVLGPLTRIVGECPHRVVVTSFSTNIARLHTIVGAAHANGRVVALAGASLKRNWAAARQCGYLRDFPMPLDEAQAAGLPRERCLLVCTGGQGEPRAALAKIATGDHPTLSLQAGDAVVFSSRVIPGNEIAIGRVQDALLRLGVRIVTHRDGMIHVSGHPARGDLEAMYAMVRPRAAVPVHGFLRHMREHADLARRCGVGEVVVVENGGVVRLAPGPVEVVDHVPAGRLSLEGNRLVADDGMLVRGRCKAIYNGALTLTLVLGRAGRDIRDVMISSTGLLETGDEGIEREMCAAVRRAVDELPDSRLADDEAVREAARIAVRRASRQLIDKRPVAHVHLVRV